MLNDLLSQPIGLSPGVTQWIAAALGYGGMSVGLAAYVMRSQRAMFLAVTAALMLMSAHFWMLGANTVAALTLFGAARWSTARAIVNAGPAARWAATVFVALATLAIAAATWSGWASVLPAIGSFIIIVVHYHLKEHRVRRGLLAAEFCWASTAVAVGSTPGLALALAGMLINTAVMMSGESRAPRNSGPSGGSARAAQARADTGRSVHSMHSVQASA